MLGDVAAVFGSIFAALQPPRLVLGAFLVLVLAVLGNGADWLWLRVGGAPVAPAGLEAGRWSESDVQASHTLAHRSLTAFAAGTPMVTTIESGMPVSEYRRLAMSAFLERQALLTERGTDERGLATLVERYRSLGTTLDAAVPRGPFAAFARAEDDAFRALLGGVLSFSPAQVLDATVAGLGRAPRALLTFAPWYVSLVALVAIIIASVLGGALSRMSALCAARGVRLGMLEAAAAARRRWRPNVLWPIVAAVVIGVLIGKMVVLGLLFRVPVLDLVGGLAYGLILLVALLAIFAIVSSLLTSPLAIAAIACGDADAFDATVRGTAYFFRAPLRTLILATTAIVALALGVLLVAGVAAGALSLAAWASSVLGGGLPEAVAGPGAIGLFGKDAPLPIGGRTARAAAAFIDLWEGILVLLVAGYAASLVFEASTRIYLALRYVCDGEDPSAIDGEALP